MLSLSVVRNTTLVSGPGRSKGRMVLVGDSAHAPSSSSGQGASLAIESAVQLVRCLRDLPYDQAFAAYGAERRPRVERIIRETTHKNSAKTAGPVGRFINAWALRIFTRLAKPERMAWMFDYRIDWDAPASDVRPKRSVAPAHGCSRRGSARRSSPAAFR